MNCLNSSNPSKKAKKGVRQGDDANSGFGLASAGGDGSILAQSIVVFDEDEHSSSSSSSSSNAPAQIRSDEPCILVSINEYMKAKELMKEGASTKTKPSFACSDPDCRQSESTVTSTGKVCMARKKNSLFLLHMQ